MKQSTNFMLTILLLFCVQGFSQGHDRVKKDNKSKDELTSAQYETGRKSCGNSLEGSTREGFTSDVATGDQPCPKGIQTCTAGQWIGPTLFDTCTNNTKNCGATVHGDVVNGYLQATVPKGTACTPAFKSCLNGVWVGPEVSLTCNEVP